MLVTPLTNDPYCKLLPIVYIFAPICSEMCDYFQMLRSSVSRLCCKIDFPSELMYLCIKICLFPSLQTWDNTRSRSILSFTGFSLCFHTHFVSLSLSKSVTSWCQFLISKHSSGPFPWTQRWGTRMRRRLSARLTDWKAYCSTAFSHQPLELTEDTDRRGRPPSLVIST